MFGHTISVFLDCLLVHQDSDWSEVNLSIQITNRKSLSVVFIPKLASIVEMVLLQCVMDVKVIILLTAEKGNG